jgi:hypothetical protein
MVGRTGNEKEMGDGDDRRIIITKEGGKEKKGEAEPTFHSCTPLYLL